MKIKFILKFFLKTNFNTFRYSFIVPFIGIFIGSYIIFMTFSIMNGIEGEIGDKINSFSYKYSYNEKDTKSYHFDNYDNIGSKKIVYLEQSYNQLFAELKMYQDISAYLDKINPYIKYKSINLNDGLIIGNDISSILELNVDDSLEIFFPADINVVTSYIPSLVLPIYCIYDYDIFDFDSRYIIASESIIKEFELNEEKVYFSDSESNRSTFKTDNDLLISAIQLEKKMYTSLSFILILISCIMIFNIMIMVMIDKTKQIDYLNIVGLSNNKIFKIMLSFNTLISLVFTFLGYLISELTIFSNYYYNLFSSVFNSLPFKIIPMNISFYELIVIYVSINFLIISFSVFPYKLRRNLK